MNFATSNSEKTPATLFIANVRSDRGYAWRFILRCYEHLALNLRSLGVKSYLAFPKITVLPETCAECVELEVDFTSWVRIKSLFGFCRAKKIEVLYLTDRPSVHAAYGLLRLAGVKRIIVHDHTSGIRKPPTGLKKVFKWLMARCWLFSADEVLAVSAFVARRQMSVAMIPESKIHVVHNFSEMPPLSTKRRLNDETQLTIFAAGRATPEKGFEVLLSAFDVACHELKQQQLRLVYAGDGPHYGELCRFRDSLASKDRIEFVGFCDNIKPYLSEADICVCPSVWEEAFCLVVLEMMLAARPIVASNCGAIPELISSSDVGLLFEPRDSHALAQHIAYLARHPEKRTEMASAAQARALQEFNPSKQLALLQDVFQRSLPFPLSLRTDATSSRHV